MVSTIQKPQTMKMILCNKCGNDMPELRKTQYGYSFCVTCSETKNLVGTKRGIPVQMGEGDHTWTETVIMDEELYLKYTEQEEMIKNSTKDPKEPINEDRDLQGPFRIINNTLNKDY
tara:strand:+ start:132 stop:482 length:351 start_codon:yes stop_codon:yes gene_type:complete